MKNNKQITCDGCGSPLKNESYIKKREKDKGYCSACTWIISRNPSDVRTVSQREFNEVIEGFLKTPPLRMKDLKARLKKERKEKKKNSKNKEDSK